MNTTELANRAKSYNGRIKFFQAKAVQDNEKLFVDFNRKQMLSSKTSKNEAFVNSLTGSTGLSPAYAKKTGKKKPNLFVDGAFQGEMFLETNENDGTYFVDSFWDKTKYLIDMYTNDIFGIPKPNMGKAIEVASKSMFDFYKNLVWKI